MFLAPRFYLANLAVFPIRGCGAFKIPAGEPWEVTREGLAWDQAWCLVHKKTGKALDEETYPQVGLIRPTFHPAWNPPRLMPSDSWKGAIQP
jgi:molybdenum cofactor sulfurtransferase